jgi:adenine-specific DNA-methyltransferase
MFCGRAAKGAACRPQAGHSPVPPPQSGHNEPVIAVASEHDLACLALWLGAREVAGWSGAEQALAEAATCDGPGAPGPAPPADTGAAGSPAACRARQARKLIQAGADPLGEAFCRLRAPAQRRAMGQVLTPPGVIASMVGWAARWREPARVVDPGTGSARFLVAAGRAWPGAELHGVETDPLAALAGRATLAAAGLAGRTRITLADYRALRLPPAAGPTLFLGNPPYVRHHQISRHWKEWLRATAARLGVPASGLAGLHAHFFLATAVHARPGDLGVLVTSAEWLDTRYGELVRALLLGPLGGEAVSVVAPAAAVFPGTAVTAAVTCFCPGTRPRGLRLRQLSRAADLGKRPAGVRVPAADLRAAPRWSPLLARGRRPGRLPAGWVELGELCQVHRGQVTGCNRVWIMAPGRPPVPPQFVFPAVTRASELLRAGAELASPDRLRRVVDLPAELAELTAHEQELASAFLAWARAAGGADSYTARHRRPWWRVRLLPPAPLLATYMARRPPAFVRNLARARHLNIAHGIYPRQPLSPATLDALARSLRRTVTPDQGRAYAGGLAKFEPKEMERLPVPGPALLTAVPR